MNKNKKILNDYEMNQKVAQNIIDIINSGDVKSWRKFWTYANPKQDNYLEVLYDLVVNDGAAALLYNAALLPPEQMIPQGFYVTFKDIKRKKLHLIKGVKGVPTYKPCTFFKELTKAQENALNVLLESEEELKEEYEKLLAKEICSLAVKFEYVDDRGNVRVFDEELIIRNNKVMYKRFQWVLEYIFNINGLTEKLDVRKIWNLPEQKKVIERKAVATIAKIEKVKNSYIERAKLKFREVFQGRAYYQPGTHSVTLPTKEQFVKSEEYYQVMFHEFAHSTGHWSLLNRASLVGNCGFGSASYSKEELVAELSSLYTLSSLNIITEEILQNSVAYIKSWGENFGKSIKHNILNTIEHSRKATNLILNLEGKNIKKGMAA